MNMTADPGLCVLFLQSKPFAWYDAQNPLISPATRKPKEILNDTVNSHEITRRDQTCSQTLRLQNSNTKQTECKIMM